jgi:histidine triad (HIT) family protein
MIFIVFKILCCKQKLLHTADVNHILFSFAPLNFPPQGGLNKRNRTSPPSGDLGGVKQCLLVKKTKRSPIMVSCLFCRIIKKDIPAKIVYDDEHTLAFHDINPQAPLHLLVIPKTHYAALHEIPADKSAIITNLFLVVNKVLQQNKCVENGYRLVVNFGPASGQAVDHIHVHILSGRNMKWPPG